MTRFSRAIFLSWYCEKGDCDFCWMSTQKKLIADPKKARRRYESIFCEAAISAACGWDIEFLSGGYGSFAPDELLYITKTVHAMTGKKQWLNFGTMAPGELMRFAPHAEGFCGTVECINEAIRDKACPSKPMSEILRMFGECDRLGLSKAITVIIGLGETMDDYSGLFDFISRHKIDRITFYALNPQRGTPYKESPELEYYAEWIRRAREDFPKLHIIAGAWRDKIEYFPRLIEAGADDITKFPGLKEFGSEKATRLEQSMKNFLGTLTRKPKDTEAFTDCLPGPMKEKTRQKIRDYGF
jgi:biotin synthase-like enzyme